MEKSDLITRLNQCGNLKELAALAGVNYQTLHNFKAGRTENMSPRRTEDVIAALNKLEKRAAVAQGENFTYIKVHEDGPNAIRDDAGLLQPFNSRVLERITPTPPDQLLMVFMDNEAMSPTFQKGDQIMIDTSINRVGDDGVYLLDAGGGDRVFRRCSRDFESGLIMVQSDNPLFKNARLTAPRKLNIAGKAIWYGRFIG